MKKKDRSCQQKQEHFILTERKETKAKFEQQNLTDTDKGNGKGKSIC